METRICRKCLLSKEMSEGMTGYLERHLDAIPEEEQTADDLYEERLKICQSCSMLVESMCRGCGCYVQLRAALAKQSCPYDKWQDKTAVTSEF